MRADANLRIMAFASECPLLGTKRTSASALHMSAFDPKRTSGDLFRRDGEVLLSVRFGG